MPYRSELKRPDLKGNFPCTVCGKIFCHSSSLSRHRMQAHFKSYQCMQCNKEISSSETLRSHMIKTHQIARMFMCRCCNWAFPDKTSLHLHTTSLSKTGNPGEVAVLARSFAEGDEFPADLHNTPSSSPPDTRDSISPEHKPQFDPPTIAPVPQFPMLNPATLSNVQMSALLNHMEMMRRNQEKNPQERISELLSLRKNNGWLENNNSFMNLTREQQAIFTLFKEMQNRKRTMTPENGPRAKKEYSESPPLTTASVSNEALNNSQGSVDSAERKNKRKSRRPQQLPQTNLLNLANLNLFTAPKTEDEEKKNNESDVEHMQPSPAISDSQTSGSGNDAHEQDHSNSLKNADDKAVDYAEKFANIGKMVGRFIELIQEDKITEEKDAVIDLAFKIREQCSDA